jgi:predicted RNase H-like nuclease (RuvC/YqgF family)
MYNTNISTTYQDDNILFLESDQLNEKEKEFIRNYIYRLEYLELFSSSENNKNIELEELSEKIKELSVRMKDSQEMKECLSFACRHVPELIDMTNCCSDIMGWMILYSFQFMHLTHMCVSEYLTTGNISNEKLNNLKMELLKK